ELVRIPVRELRLHRKLRLIYRKSASLSHAAQAFLKVAEAAAVKHGDRYRFQRERCPFPTVLTPVGRATRARHRPRWDKFRKLNSGWSVAATRRVSCVARLA